MSERDAYVEKMKARLDEWNADIAKLEARAKAAKADARLEYEKQIEALKAQQKQAQSQFEKMCESSGSAWKDLRAGVDGAWNSLESAMKSAASRFG